MPEPLAKFRHESFHRSYKEVVDPALRSLVDLLEDCRQGTSPRLLAAEDLSDLVIQSHLSGVIRPGFPFSFGVPEAKARKLTLRWPAYMSLGWAGFEEELPLQPAGN